MPSRRRDGDRVKQPVVEKEIVHQLVPEDGAAEDIGVAVAIMDMSADRRDQLFPDLGKVIVDNEVEIPGSCLSLNVTSAPAPELE